MGRGPVGREVWKVLEREGLAGTVSALVKQEDGVQSGVWSAWRPGKGYGGCPLRPREGSRVPTRARAVGLRGRKEAACQPSVSLQWACQGRSHRGPSRPRALRVRGVHFSCDLPEGLLVLRAPDYFSGSSQQNQRRKRHVGRGLGELGGASGVLSPGVMDGHVVTQGPVRALGGVCLARTTLSGHRGPLLAFR